MDILNKYSINDLKKIVKYYNFHNDINMKGIKKDNLIDELLKRINIDNEGYFTIKDIISDNEKYNVQKIIDENKNNKEIIKELNIEIEKLKEIIKSYENKKKDKYLRERDLLLNKQKIKVGRKKI
jgi:hypothetical protein